LFRIRPDVWVFPAPDGHEVYTCSFWQPRLVDTSSVGVQFCPMRLLVKVVASAVVVYFSLLAGLFFVMRNPTTFGRVMRHVPGPAFAVIPFKRLWFVARSGRLKVGDTAPDFRLVTSDKEDQVQLSSFRGHQPVVLVFGSYT
jgi:hypothetical protein